MNLLNVKVERVDNKQAEQVESVEQHSPEEEENVHGYTESPTKACVDQPHFQNMTTLRISDMNVLMIIK